MRELWRRGCGDGRRCVVWGKFQVWCVRASKSTRILAPEVAKLSWLDRLPPHAGDPGFESLRAHHSIQEDTNRGRSWEEWLWRWVVT